MKFIILVSAFAALVLALQSYAADAEKTIKSGEKTKAKIDFEDELIEGHLKRPDFFHILDEKKSDQQRKLIILRNNFLPEMRKRAEDVYEAGTAE